MVDMFGAAGCFAGFVQFLLTNKNCTRAADEFYLADKLSPPALVRDAFCLTTKCYGVSLCLAWRFALRQNATGQTAEGASFSV